MFVKKLKKIFIIVLSVILLLFFLFSIWDVSNEILINEMQRQCSYIINDSIQEAFSGVGDNLFEVTEHNSVNIMTVNAYNVNIIRARISDIIYDKFDNSDYHTVSLNIGTVICPYIFAGRGPCINVSIVPVSEVDVNIESVNETYGINQVVNNIYVDVDVEVRSAGRLNLAQTRVKNRIIAVQTLITGNVPNTYVNVKK